MSSATRSEGGASSTFVFLLGSGRCGSSLIQEVLSRHPDVGFLSNLDDRLGSSPVTRWNAHVYRRVPVALTKKGRARFAPSEGYRVLDREVSPAVSTPVRDLVATDATPWLAGRFRRFFEEQASRQGKRIFLHKFTGWPRARFIASALPGSRFVHIIRDGRAVANSLLQMPWWRGYGGPEAWGLGPLPDPYQKEWEAAGRSFPVLAALEWKVLMDAFEETKSAIPSDRWAELRYEDFIDDPRRSTEVLLSSMGLTWSESFERSFRDYRFDRTRTTAFLKDLAPEDVGAIEEVLGDALDRLGYASETNGPGRLGQME